MLSAVSNAFILQISHLAFSSGFLIVNTDTPHLSEDYVASKMAMDGLAQTTAY
jgi:hypothetical protein